MTDEEIKEFRLLVHSTLTRCGKTQFTSHDLRETSVKYAKLHLSKGFFINGEVRVSVFSYVHSCRVFFETAGGPGIYGVGNARNDYNLEAMKELLPALRGEALLDLIADL